MASDTRINDGIMRDFVIEPALDAIQDAHQTTDRFARRQTAAYADAAIHAMYQTADADYFARWWMPPGEA